MTEALQHPNRCMTPEMGVTLKEYLEAIIEMRFASLDVALIEARRGMEKLMAGFPTEYAKKLELEQTAQMVKELKDKDLGEIKKLIALKLSLTDYDTKHEVLLEKLESLKEKARGWESIEANINGRLWTLGMVVVGAFVILGYLFNYGLHLPPGVVK